MSNRHALLIGVDSYANASDNQGALADVKDLYNVLRHLGYPASNIQVLTSPALTLSDLPDAEHLGQADHRSIVDSLRTLASRQRGDNPTAFVHVSSKGVTREHIGQAVVTSDADLDAGTGLLPLHEIVAPFADQPIRSLFVSIDAGFAGVGRSFGATVRVPPAISGGDPVLLAGGHLGHVQVHRLGGAVRGALAWSLARVLESMSAQVPWTFEHLLARVRQAHETFRIAQAPTMLPTRAEHARLGALLEDQPYGVPWRGVSAHYQAFEDWSIITHPPGTGIGNWIVGPQGSQSEWIWQSAGQQWNYSSFQINITTPGTPGPGANYAFENNGFASYGGQLPFVGPNDASYRVQIPGGDDTWLIVRNRNDPTSVEWYSTFTGVFWSFGPGDVLVFTAQQPTAADWNNKTWQLADERRR